MIEGVPPRVTARLQALGQAEVVAQVAYQHAHELLLETTAAVLEALGYDPADGAYTVDNGTGAITHTPAPVASIERVIGVVERPELVLEEETGPSAEHEPPPS